VCAARERERAAAQHGKANVVVPRPQPPPHVDKATQALQGTAGPQVQIGTQGSCKGYLLLCIKSISSLPRQDRQAKCVQAETTCSLKDRAAQYPQADPQTQKGGTGTKCAFLWRSTRCCKDCRMSHHLSACVDSLKAVVSLCQDIDPRQAILDLNSSVDAEISFNHTTISSAEYAISTSMLTGRIPRFKQSLQFIIPPSSSTADVLDTCLPADYILLLLSATVEVPESSLNTLRSILAQGTPSVIPVTANISAHSDVKVRSDVKRSLLTYIQQYLPNADKILASDDRAEAASIIRMICTGVPSGIRWREQRSYILPEAWRWDESENAVVLSGTIRGTPLHVDRLIHLPSYGDFQIEKVCSILIISDCSYVHSPTVVPNRQRMAWT
jgi:hypothetical protein